MKKNRLLCALLVVSVFISIASFCLSVCRLVNDINSFEDTKEYIIRMTGSYNSKSEVMQEHYVKPIRNSAILVSLCSIEILASFAVLIIYLLPVQFASKIAEAKQRKREARKEKKIAKLKEKLNDMEQ